MGFKKTKPSAMWKPHLDLYLPGPIITFGKAGRREIQAGEEKCGAVEKVN